MVKILDKKKQWFFEYLLVRGLIASIQLMTPRQSLAVCKVLAWLIADVLKIRRKTCEENLVSVFPEMDSDERRAMTRQMWVHLLRMGVEVVQGPRKIHKTNWRRYVNIVDKKLMTSYLIDYRPLVAVSGHFGNFEMAGYVTGLLGMPSYTVARKLDNPWLDKFVNKFRARGGLFILPKDGSAHRVEEILKEGRILTILGDQHAGTKGCWIDFLGRPASCHKAVALFTLNGRAPMMVSYCRQLDEPMKFEIGCTGIVDPLELPPELTDVKALTQWYNDRLAKAILKSPAQYWWLHRRWKEKPVRVTNKSAAA